MANGGHGGGNGGGGGGGGGAKKGLMSSCLGRLVVFYLGALVLIILLLALANSGLASKIPGLSRLSTGGSTTSTTNSTGIVPVASGSLSQGGGPIAPSGSIGGAGATAGSGASTQSRSVNSPQGGILTSTSYREFYIVQPGDTLSTIAGSFNTTPDTLKQYNVGLGDNITIGQVIFLPPEAVPVQPLPNTGHPSGAP